MSRATLTTSNHRLTRSAMKTSMRIIALHTRLPRETSLGILAGIANMDTMNRLTMLNSTARRPIMGKLLKTVKWKTGRGTGTKAEC